MDSSEPLSGSSPLRGVAPRQVLMTISILLNISSPLGEGDINNAPQHILNNPKECAGTPPNKNSISIYRSFLKLFAKKSLTGLAQDSGVPRVRGPKSLLTLVGVFPQNGSLSDRLSVSTPVTGEVPFRLSFFHP